MVKMPECDVPLTSLSDEGLVLWAKHLAERTQKDGKGWITRLEIVRMAEEIVRLRKEAK